MKPIITNQSIYQYRYYPELDGMRGFAVLWVIAFHYVLPFGRDGLFGVDIFFVISGFLITTLLIKEWQKTARISLKNFYIRRILRLFPALFVFLLVVSFFAPRSYIFSTLFYTTNWIKALHLQPESLFLDHTWSLSIEEQYYLVWPFLLMLLLNRKISEKRIVLITLGLGLVSAVSRAFVWTATQDWFRVYMGTDLHADGLLFGSAVGLLVTFNLLPDFKKHKRTVSVMTFFAGLFFLWLLIEQRLTSAAVPLFGNFCVSVGTVIILLRIVYHPSRIIKKIFSFLPLVKTGVISYGLYLWHVPVGIMVDRWDLELNFLLVGLIKTLITFVVAGLSYVMIEKRVLSLKHRFQPQLLKSLSTIKTPNKLL